MAEVPTDPYVLVAMRRPHVAQSFRSALIRAGVAPLTASSVRMATEIVGRVRPALAYVDAQLDEDQGMHLIEALRAQAIPSVLMTVRDDLALVEHGLALGVVDVVRLPVHPHVFALKVATALRSLRVRLPQHTPLLLTTGDHRVVCDAYCPSCQGATCSGPRCDLCGAEEPEGGWPSLSASGYEQLGRTVGRYQLRRALGEGTVGKVYAAHDPLLHQCVAIKVFNSSLSSEALTTAVRREVVSLSTIESPHVIGFRNVITADNGALALVTELADGTSLAERVSNDGIPPLRVALEIVRQVAVGLQAAHDRQVVHCDVKPSNIVVEIAEVHRLRARVLDFGIAQIVGREESDPSLFFGTPAYAAPEQFKDGRSVDARTDIYSLGGVLHYLLTGAPPYDGATPRAVLKQHLKEPVPSLTDRQVEMPVELLKHVNRVLAKALAKAPENRFSSMTAFIRATDELQDRITNWRILSGSRVTAPHQDAAVADAIDALRARRRELADRYSELRRQANDPGLTRGRAGRIERERAALLQERHALYAELKSLKQLHTLVGRSGAAGRVASAWAAGPRHAPRPAEVRQSDCRLRTHARARAK